MCMCVTTVAYDRSITIIYEADAPLIQRAVFTQPLATISYFGLQRTHPTGATCPTKVFRRTPVSLSYAWSSLSSVPLKTYLASADKQPPRVVPDSFFLGITTGGTSFLNPSRTINASAVFTKRWKPSGLNSKEVQLDCKIL